MIFSFQNASFRDSETGLYNQAYFMEILNREWHKFIRDKTSLSVLFLNPHVNLENKTEKDFFIKIANLLQESTYRSNDIICRFDNNFFAIGLFDLNGEGTNIVIKRIHNKIRECVEVNLTVGAINVLPSHAIEFEEIFVKTANSLEKAEAKGENAYSIHQIN